MGRRIPSPDGGWRKLVRGSANRVTPLLSQRKFRKAMSDPARKPSAEECPYFHQAAAVRASPRPAMNRGIRVLAPEYRSSSEAWMGSAGVPGFEFSRSMFLRIIVREPDGACERRRNHAAESQSLNRGERGENRAEGAD